MLLQESYDFPVAQIYQPEDLPRDGFCAVLEKDRDLELRLKELSEIMGPRLIVQEVWQELLPDTSLLISSAICGGEITERFRTAAKSRACWLLLEPIKEVFSLPCLNALGTPAEAIPNGPQFYSEALCCYYTHSPGKMVLWDTEETLLKKIQLAREAGFQGIVA